MKNLLLKREEEAILSLRSLYRSYGYTPYKMSRFEEYDLYVRNKDFLVSDQIITFSGPGGRLLAMKPDVTLSIVKNAPEQSGVIQKVYYNENVYRDYREIVQAGLECVGDLGEYEIAEVVLLAVKSLQLLGQRFVLDISHMGLLEAVLNSCGFGAEEKANAMACLRRKNFQELKNLCGADETALRKVEALENCRGSGLQALEAVLSTDAEFRAMEELKRLWSVLEGSGCAGSVRLDFSEGSSLGYYSGVVFRGYLEGIPSSVLSGGQYDKLPRKMGRKAKAIGFAIYVDLLEDFSREEDALHVDTLILHDGTVETGILTRIAREAAEKGSVLVSRELPKDRTWNTIVRFEKGERMQ